MNIAAVLRRSAGTPTDRLVLAVIAGHADPDGTGAFPGHAAIVEITGLSDRQVRRSIARLVELGELERTSSGTGRTHRRGYRILIPAVKGDSQSAFTAGKGDSQSPIESSKEDSPSPFTVKGDSQSAFTAGKGDSQSAFTAGKGDSQSGHRGDHPLSETSRRTTPPLPPHNDAAATPGAAQARPDKPSTAPKDPATAKAKPKTRRLRWNRKSITIPATSDTDVATVFDRWCAARRQAGYRGPFKLTTERRDAIDYALSELPLPDVADAAEGWLNDDWPERVKHSDLPVLFRTVGAIEKWRDLHRGGPPAARASPASNGRPVRGVAYIRQQLAISQQARNQEGDASP